MWIPRTSKCEMCGVDYTQTSPRHKYCSDCGKINRLRIAKEYNATQHKQNYVPKGRVVKAKPEQPERIGNLQKALQEFGPYGLEILQAFFNVLHRADVIAKKNNMVVTVKTIDTIMSDFRQNKIG